jgi:hypothetical protein
MSDKRLEGEIRNWDGSFGFIEFINNRGRVQSLFYSSRNVTPDWRGSRAWAFSPRVPVSFTISHRNGKPHAEDVAPIFPMSEPEDIMGYRETSELVSKTIDYGFVQRPCGDRLFVHIKDVVPGFENRWNFLEPGSPVYHGVRFDAEAKRWRAAYIELYSYAELQSFRQEAEPEPQIEIKAEPVPEILSQKNKSKTLLQLITLEKRVRREFQEKNHNKP